MDTWLDVWFDRTTGRRRRGRNTKRMDGLIGLKLKMKTESLFGRDRTPRRRTDGRTATDDGGGDGGDGTRDANDDDRDDDRVEGGVEGKDGTERWTVRIAEVDDARRVDVRRADDGVRRRRGRRERGRGRDRVSVCAVGGVRRWGERGARVGGGGVREERARASGGTVSVGAVGDL